MGNEPLIVLDTHVLLWWVSGDRISKPARRAIGEYSDETPLVASSITALEIATAVRRGRLQLSSPLDHWFAALSKVPRLRFEPVSAEIAQLAGSLDDGMPGDPADRIIVATARMLGGALVTADKHLHGNPLVATIW